MKLIDKDALVAKIKKLRKKNDAYYKPSHIADVCYEEILSLIDTLEVKEEVLDEEGKAKLMKKCVHKEEKDFAVEEGWEIEEGNNSFSSYDSGSYAQYHTEAWLKEKEVK